MKNLHAMAWWRSLRKRISRGGVEETDAPEIHEVAGFQAVFPYLPKIRRRLSICDTDEPPIQPSLFFRMLPLEIRRMIYIQLLGDERIHIYLGPNWALGKWEWYGGVCFDYGRTKDGKLIEKNFQYDGCVRYNTSRGAWPKWIDLIGALPWLQSCRQAYSEAVDVLYSSNELHLESYRSVLFWNLPRLFLPQRLARIRRLGLKMYNDGYNVAIRDSSTGLPEFDRLLHCICSNFPRLSKLRIRVHSPQFDRERVSGGKPLSLEDALSRAILFPMDRLVHHFGFQLQHCEIAIGGSYYDEIMHCPGIVVEYLDMRLRWSNWTQLKRNVAINDSEYIYRIQRIEDGSLGPSTLL